MKTLYILIALFFLAYSRTPAQCSFTTNILASGPTKVCSGGSVGLMANPTDSAWTQKAAFGGAARSGAVGFSIGGKGYIGTGFGQSGAYNDFWGFDPNTNTWAQKASFGGTARFAAVGFSIGGKGYIGMGNSNGYANGNNSNGNQTGDPYDFWEYDTLMNTWTQKACLPDSLGIEYAVGFSIGNKGYIGTGNKYNTGLTNEFWEYDPGTDQWTRKRSFTDTALGGRTYAVGFSIGGYGYIGTGWNGNICSNDFWQYDPVADLWTRKASLPDSLGLLYAVGFSIGSKGYIGTGSENNSGPFPSDFWEYDPSADQWTRKADFGGGARTGAVGFSIGSKGYIGTGSVNTDFWQYGPSATYIWSNGATTQSINVSLPGTYVVTVTSIDGCTATASQTLAVIPPPVLNIAASASVTCPGDTITLAASGAETYLWNTGSVDPLITVSSDTTTTYSVKGTGADGCTNVAIQTISVNPAPTIITSANPTSIGSGLSCTLIAGGAVTYFWSGGPATASYVVSPTVTSNYIVTGTDSNGCSNTATQVVSVHICPVIEVSPAIHISMTNCKQNKPLYFTASGGSSKTKYSWLPASGLNATKSATVQASPSVTTIYTVTAATPGCPPATANATFSFVSVSVTPPSATICPGDSVTLRGTLSMEWKNVGSPLWSSTPGLNRYTGQTVVARPKAPGAIYTVSITPSLCSNPGTATVQVVVATQPTVSVIASSTSICSGGSVTLTAKGASSYSLNGDSAGSVMVLSPASTSTYLVTGIKSDCPGSAPVITITVKPTPTLSVSGTTNICPGAVASLTASGATNYTWSPGNYSTSVISVTPSSSCVYTLSGSNPPACISSKTIALKIGPDPIITVIPSSTQVCGPRNITLTASGATTYTWSNGAHTSSIVVTPSATTVYTVSGDLAGCTQSSSSTASIIVNSVPVVTVNSGSICSGSSFTIFPSGAYTYSITGNSFTVAPITTTSYSVSGTSLQGCVSASPAVTTISVIPKPKISAQGGTICAGQSFSIVPSGALTYTCSGGSFFVVPLTTTTYTVSGTNAEGCKASVIVTVTVRPVPSLSVLASPTAICPGGSSTLTASGASSFLWSTSASTNSIVVSPSVTTTFSVSGTTLSCGETKTLAVQVSSISLISLTPSVANTCIGGSLTLAVNGISKAATIYEWNSWNPYSGSGQTIVTGSPSFTVKPNYTGLSVYYVKAKSSNCMSIGTASIYVADVPAVSVTPKDTSICAGSVTITAVGATDYTWSSSSNSVVTHRAIYTDTPTLTTTYTVLATNAACTNPARAIAKITVNATPSISVWPSTSTISSGSGVLLYASGIATCTWSPSKGLNTTQSLNVLASPDTTTIYTISGAGPGCSVSPVTVTVNVKPAVVTNWVVGSGRPLNLPVPDGPYFYLQVPGFIMWQFTGSGWVSITAGWWQSWGMSWLGIDGTGGSNGGDKPDEPCRVQKNSCLADALGQAVKDQTKKNMEEYWTLDENINVVPAGDLMTTSKNVFVGGSPTDYERDNMTKYKLSVNGGLRAKKIVVENANWPDYVFGPEYIPMSTDSLAAFIKQNRHLPGVLPECEVEKNGIALGEMQAIMLQKIEELVLQAVHLKEKNKILKAQVQDITK